jgi:hypothetical protein
MLAILVSPAVAAPGPLKFKPKYPDVGQRVTVSGKGFKHRAKYKVIVDDITYKRTYKTSKHGKLKFSFLMPPTDKGTAIFVAAKLGKQFAVAEIFVSDKEQQPTNNPPTIDCANSPAAPEPDGKCYAYNFDDEYDDEDFNDDDIPLSVAAAPGALKFSPKKPAVGKRVIVKGSGFKKKAKYKVIVNDVIYKRHYKTSKKGKLKFSFRMPPTESGGAIFVAAKVGSITRIAEIFVSDAPPVGKSPTIDCADSPAAPNPDGTCPDWDFHDELDQEDFGDEDSADAAAFFSQL